MASFEAERQIGQYIRAKEIFAQLAANEQNPNTSFEVSVIGSVLPHVYRPEYEELVGRGFLVGNNAMLLTTENLEPGSASYGPLQFAKSFVKGFDKVYGGDDSSQHGFEHVITMRDTGGVEPEVGDILIEQKEGGVFGAYHKVRVVKPDMTEDEIRTALDFMMETP